MIGTKHPLQSRTIWGVLLMLVALGLSQAGYTLTEQDQAELLDQVIQAVNAVTALIGTILVVYGRMKATKRIKVPGVPGSFAIGLLAIGLCTAGGCAGLSDTQRAAAITRTYTAAVHGATAAADAGYLSLDDAEAIDRVRAEASTEIDAMWDAVLGGAPLNVEHAIKRAESVVDRLYQQSLQLEETRDDRSRSTGAGAWPDPGRAGDRGIDPGPGASRSADTARAGGGDPRSQATRRRSLGTVAWAAAGSEPARRHRLTEPAAT